MVAANYHSDHEDILSCQNPPDGETLSMPEIYPGWLCTITDSPVETCPGAVYRTQVNVAKTVAGTMRGRGLHTGNVKPSKSLETSDSQCELLVGVSSQFLHAWIWIVFSEVRKPYQIFLSEQHNAFNVTRSFSKQH